MNGDTLQIAKELLEPWAVEFLTPESDHLGVCLNADALIPAVTALVTNHWGYLVAITGIDLIRKEDKIEILYQFFECASLLTLRIKVDRMAGHVPSICPIIPSA